MAEPIQDTGQSKPASNTELFHASKKLFLKAVSENQSDETKLKCIGAMKCLLLDSDKEIAKCTLELLTEMLEKGNDELANYVIDLGLGFLPNVSKDFAEVEFECLVKFVNILLSKEPSWICDKLLKPIENMIVKSVLSPDANLVGYGFSMVQKIADYDARIIFNDTRLPTTLVDILRASKNLFDKHAPQEKARRWPSLFETIPHRVKLGHPELFQHLISTLNYLILKVNKDHVDEKMEETFMIIYNTIGENPFKANSIVECLRILYALVQKSGTFADKVADEVLETMKVGIQDQRSAVRYFCEVILRQFVFIDDGLDAQLMLIKNLHTQLTSNPDEFASNPSFSALKHFSSIPNEAHVLVSLGFTEALKQGLALKAWSTPCFECIGICAHTVLHANRLAEKGCLKQILKEYQPEWNTDVKALISKTTDIQAISFLFCEPDLLKADVLHHTRLHLVKLLKSRMDIFQPEHISMAEKLSPKNKKSVENFQAQLDKLRKSKASK